MSAEHHRGVPHALEEAEEALRAEQRAQRPHSDRNAKVRARLAQLLSERDHRQRTLESLKETPVAAARLPENLTPPFVVKVRRAPQRALRRLLPAPLLVLAMLALGWEEGPRARLFNLGLLLMVVLVQTGLHVARRPRWHFSASGFTRGGPLWTPHFVRHAEVEEVSVSATEHQRRQGVGTLWVRLRPLPTATAPRHVLLRDVPEPERLARWLRERSAESA